MKIFLLLHGPFSGNTYDKIFCNIGKIPKSILNDFSVTLVSYVADYEKTKNLVESINTMNLPVSIVQCKDLINPGFFNINRQIFTVSSGLKTIPSDSFVIKLRNDQFIDFRKFFHLLDKIKYFSNHKEKLLTTNCFTRKDRLYHPSDMFLCAMQPILLKYYSCPLSRQTQESCIFEMREALEKGEQFAKIMHAPEMDLFKSYLQLNQWEIKNTQEDSYNAIKKYCYVVNAWDINLKWGKKRTPLKPAGALIYPQYFSISPFVGAPVEKASCYCRSDFNGSKTLKDVFMIAESKFLWLFWKDQLNSILRSNYFKRFIRLMIIFITEILPFFIAKHLAPIAYSADLKAEVKAKLINTPVYRIYKNYKEKKLSSI